MWSIDDRILFTFLLPFITIICNPMLYIISVWFKTFSLSFSHTLCLWQHVVLDIWMSEIELIKIICVCFSKVFSFSLFCFLQRQTSCLYCSNTKDAMVLSFFFILIICSIITNNRIKEIQLDHETRPIVCVCVFVFMWSNWFPDVKTTTMTFSFNLFQMSR